MPTTAELKNTLAEPLHVVAGAGDLAVAKLREVPSRLSELKVERKVVRDRAQVIQNKIRGAVSDARAKAEDTVADLRDELRGKNAKDAVADLRDKAGDAVKEARELQHKATGFAQDQVSRVSGVVGETAGRASETYSELAARGKDVVARLRGRQAGSGPALAPVAETGTKADEVTV